jgi:hypothetical protein
MITRELAKKFMLEFLAKITTINSLKFNPMKKDEIESFSESKTFKR